MQLAHIDHQRCLWRDNYRVVPVGVDTAVLEVELVAEVADLVLAVVAAQ